MSRFNDHIDHKARQTGAVLVFEEGVTKEQAERLLARLQRELKLESSQVQEFNPTWGQPVFYVP